MDIQTDPAPQPHSLTPQTPWYECAAVPHSVAVVLYEEGYQAIGQVLSALRSGHIAALKRMRKPLLRELRVALARAGLLGRPDLATPLAPPPGRRAALAAQAAEGRSLAEQVAGALGCPWLEEVDRALVRGRWYDGLTLRELAAGLGLDRAAAVTRFNEACLVLRRSFGAETRRLLATLVREAEEAGGVLVGDEAAGRMGLDDPRALVMALRLAGLPRVCVVEQRFISLRPASDMAPRLCVARQLLAEHGGAGATIPLRRVIERRCGLRLDDNLAAALAPPARQPS